MTDLERFEVVIAELRALLQELYAIGLSDDAVLIGAQVVALEQRTRNVPIFQLPLPSGIAVTRAFSFEPDLVIDAEEPHRLEGLPEALRRRGFERSRTPGKPSRWSKRAGDSLIELDLFCTTDCDEDLLPTPMTRLRGVPRLRLHTIQLDDTWSIKVPDAYSYLSLKLEAKLRLRPGNTKDSLDLFIYAQVVGAPEINAALERVGGDGERVRSELRQLFGQEDSAGVQDVLAAAGQSMNPEERALLVRAVMDAFESVT
jgi:hypothetical protein